MGAPDIPEVYSGNYFDDVQEELTRVYKHKAYELLRQHEKTGAFTDLRENDCSECIVLVASNGEEFYFDGWDGVCYAIHFISKGYEIAMAVQSLTDDKISNSERLRRIAVLSNPTSD